MQQPTVFFCYAWGSEERYQKLLYVRDRLVEHTHHTCRVVLDKHDYEDNQDFDELRERIRSYDLIVVFCTPDMKRVVLDPDARANKDREVLKEYTIIEERFHENAPSVYPVVMEGAHEDALLPIFRSKNARNLDEFGIGRLRSGSTGILDRKAHSEFKRFLSKVFNTAWYNHKNRTKEYEDSRQAMDELFSLTNTVEIPRSCLVVPRLYGSVLHQSCYFVAGRKGAGKSTFIGNFREMDRERFDRSYKQSLPISVETFQHDYIFSTLLLKHQPDGNIMTSYDLLCLFWQVYFALQVVATICMEIEIGNITRGDGRFSTFNRTGNKLKQLLGLRRGRSYRSIQGDSVPKAMFEAAVDLVDEQFDRALDKCLSREILVASFAQKLNVQEIMEEAFGESLITRFIDALSYCDKRILISLDGFDTHSEDFRSTTERLDKEQELYSQRTDYERLFFRTLIEVVTAMKSGSFNDEVMREISNQADFCIILPKDRYDQIVQFDRDSFKKPIGSLSWSAYELLQLVTLRLEYLATTIDADFTVCPTGDFYQRLDNALGFFPGLPKAITMEIQGNFVSMELFNYILRSSFWRPRDVISNLSCLLSRVVDMSGDEPRWLADGANKLSEEEVKLAIKDNAKIIIAEEFVGEYGHAFKNLKSVLQQFHGLTEFTDAEEFEGIVSKIRFDTLLSRKPEETPEKLRVLYELGIVGIRYTRQFASQMHYQSHICFSFSEGMSPFDDYTKHRSTRGDTSFVFNPIFARELGLRFNSRELLGNWDHDYVLRNYRMMRQGRPM